MGIISKLPIDLVGATEGGRVIGVCQDGKGYYGLRIMNQKREFAVWFLRDPEDNGPGWFELQEVDK